jgi:YbgC/YbaW family acyl-CoA thioester hydrolase
MASAYQDQTRPVAARSVLWAPTIAFCGSWGVGSLYAIQSTLAYGWSGFLLFALANAGGLFLFGWLLGSSKRRPDEILLSVEEPYFVLFLLAQICAVAIAIFGFVAYVWTPIAGAKAATGAGLLILLGCSIGHSARLTTLKLLHIAYFLAGLLAAVISLGAFRATGSVGSVPFSAADSRFLGLLAPMAVGALLGPWSDVRQWRRVAQIRREGGSARLAYGVGALVLFSLLGLNALLAAAAPGALAVGDWLWDSAARSDAHRGLTLAAGAFLVWGVITALAAIDSAYESLKELTARVVARSPSPLMALIPNRLVSSPLWIVLAASGAAAASLHAGLSVWYLAIPIATLLAGSCACLLCEALGGERSYDATLNSMIGLSALLIFVTGYVPPTPALMAIAPVIGLLGAAPSVASLFGWRVLRDKTCRIQTVARPEPPPATVTIANHDASASFGFDGDWFVLHVVPTYEETNSVGNVYFSNYLRWVGKARELFFHACMPDFDLNTTEYYVLTRSIRHDFRREAREFEPVVIRIKISHFNRKFVTLAHEVQSETRGLLGRGEQSLMFVDTEDFHPLDIPRAIVEHFRPHSPKEPSLAAKSAIKEPSLFE